MSGQRSLSVPFFGSGLWPRLRRPRVRLSPALISWFQVGPLALVLIALVALPAFLFLVVSFWDYDRIGIYPAFMTGQLPGVVYHAGDLPGLYQLAAAVVHRLGHHAVRGIQYRLVPGVPCANGDDPNGAVLCCAPFRSGPPASFAPSPGSHSSAATVRSIRS